MKNLSMFLLSIMIFTSCSSDQAFKNRVKNALVENPEILTEVINSNPDEFFKALQNAAKIGQNQRNKEREIAVEKDIHEKIDSPFNPEIRSDEAIRGDKNGIITIVEYADFECSFCAKSFNTTLSLMKKYKGKIRFIYKHLPLDFHQNAMLAAKYYEALRLQDNDYAFKLHDIIYENQIKLTSLGEKFLKVTAKKLGANMEKLKVDIKSKNIQARIESDIKEAAKFGFQGTPGYLLNGVPIKGAYPESYFVNIINRLKSKGKIKI